MPAPALAVFALLAGITAAQDVDFNRDVRPILSANCFACHGHDAEKREAGLRLDRASSARAERKGRRAIAPGDLTASEGWRRINATDPDLLMPPPSTHKTLTRSEIDVLRRWIESGADYAKPWSLVPPRRRSPPAVTRKTWPRTFVDRWILSRLEAEGLQPSTDADRRTLIRRITLDLTGLPPTPADVARFVADQGAGAFERVVDRLLASPHFGERMAMYWLDLVRYADTVGYHGDQEHPISPYRDWVIDAFNANMPFDRFTVEQIAGDLLPNPTTAQKVATGYNRLLQTTHEGGAQAKEYLAIYSADRVRNLGSVWLGATVGCAQCHDHKYDPYTQKDFYSLAAFFADVEEKGDFAGSPNRSPTTRPPEMKLPDGRRTMITVAKKPRLTRVLPRGDWLDESGEVVRPAVPHTLGRIACGERRATRLDLARWLVSKDHPQTARVLVNRLWYLFFGKGLSSRLDDLGAQGEPPVHPELLDALALEFVDSEFDVKAIVRLLVTSRAYAQSSRATPAARARDPHNRLLARQSRWRLPAEMIRDVALATSGLLVTEVGGGSVKPYQPARYYRHLNFPTRRYVTHEDARQWRRGVYVHWQRMFLHPMLRAFDAPTREECCAERAISNTPKASLTLLNDPTFVEAARALAARLIDEAATDQDRIARAFALAVSRPPTMPERRVLSGLLARHLAAYRTDSAAAKELIGVGLSAKRTDLDAAELAAWTSLARVVLNLSETFTRL
ncbi:MAG: hypothetical protein CMJ18_01015 [Phycisphaeraceae bacterium]|nr:hypothetical protein [Phycisphaeraceae bacterium]